MSREIKLSLLFGFVALLVVGVVVSDHLSAARVATLAEMPDQPDPGDFADRAPVQRPSPGVPRRPESGSNDSDAGTVRTTWVDDAGRFGQRAVDWFNQGNGPRAAVGIEGREDGDAPDAGGAGGPPEPDSPGGALAPDSPETRPKPNEVEMGKPMHHVDGFEDVPVDEIRLHRVARGENLWQIAEQYYADGQLYRALGRFNEGRVGADLTIRLGATLLIPPKAVLEQGGAVSFDRERSAKPSARPVQQARVRTYVVKKGDTLSEIAQRELGTATRWEEILKLNAGRIDRAEDIWIGMELTLPAE